MINVDIDKLIHTEVIEDENSTIDLRVSLKVDSATADFILDLQKKRKLSKFIKFLVINFFNGKLILRDSLDKGLVENNSAIIEQLQVILESISKLSASINKIEVLDDSSKTSKYIDDEVRNIVKSISFEENSEQESINKQVIDSEELNMETVDKEILNKEILNKETIPCIENNNIIIKDDISMSDEDISMDEEEVVFVTSAGNIKKQDIAGDGYFEQVSSLEKGINAPCEKSVEHAEQDESGGQISQDASGGIFDMFKDFL